MHQFRYWHLTLVLATAFIINSSEAKFSLLFLDSIVLKDISRYKLVSAMGEAAQNVSMDRNSTTNQTEQNALRNYSTSLPTAINEMIYTHQCFEDVVTYVESLNRSVLWAVQMLDATGQFGSGFFEGRVTYLGDHKECTELEGTIPEDDGLRNLTMKGRYCNVRFNIPNPTDVIGEKGRWAFCVPSSCGNREVEYLAKSALDILNISEIKFTSVMCHYQRELDAGCIATICIICVILGLVFIGTFLDVLFYFIPDTRPIVRRKLAAVEEDEQPLLQSQQNDYGAGQSPFDGNIPDSELNGTQTQTTSGKSDTTVLYSGPNPDVYLQLSTKVEDNRRHSDITHRGIRTLLAFSCWFNIPMIVDTRQPRGSVVTMFSIRCLSFVWISLGHSLSMMMVGSDNANSFVQGKLENIEFYTVYNYWFAVDSFFLVGGVIVSFNTLKQMKANKGKLNWFLFYVKHYFEITVVYMLVLAVYTTLVPVLMDGSLWLQEGFEVQSCKKTWWANLLYIQNLIPLDKPCMDWAWYLAADMQFYVLSPLIVVPLYFRPKLGYFLTLIFMIMSIVTPWVISIDYEFGTDVISSDGVLSYLNPSRQYFYYTAPYCRMAPFVVGVFLGYLFYKSDNHIYIARMANLFLWTLSAIVALLLVYGQHGIVNNYEEASSFERPVVPQDSDATFAPVYNAVSRTLWALCVSWVILSCQTGHGGFVGSLLTWAPFMPLGRLCLGAYLVHPIVYDVMARSQGAPLNLSGVNLAMFFLSNISFCFIISFFLSVGIQSPVQELMSIWLDRPKKTT